MGILAQVARECICGHDVHGGEAAGGYNTALGLTPTPQPSNPITLQPRNPTTLQTYHRAALQLYGPAALQIHPHKHNANPPELLTFTTKCTDASLSLNLNLQL